MKSSGFWHEQSRPDRDYFVYVRWENIDHDSKGQFLKEASRRSAAQSPQPSGSLQQPVDVDNGNVPYVSNNFWLIVFGTQNLISNQPLAARA